MPQQKGLSMMDLTTNLFDVMSRVMDSENPEELQQEVIRAKTVSKVADTIIKTAEVSIKAKKIELDTGEKVNIPLLEKGEE